MSWKKLEKNILPTNDASLLEKYLKGIFVDRVDINNPPSIWVKDGENGWVLHGSENDLFRWRLEGEKAVTFVPEKEYMGNENRIEG